MPLLRTSLALSTALAAGWLAAGSAGAGSAAPAACGPAGYAYAGLTAQVGTHGIGARITPLSTPVVESGYVAGWVGVGGPGQGPNGADEWVQVGYNSTPGSESKLYYEVVQPGSKPAYAELDAHVPPGAQHRLAVLEMSSRPNHWRVWVDGRAVSPPILLPGSHDGRLVPMAEAERWDGGRPACNRYAYHFERIALSASPGGVWRRLRNAYFRQDDGTQLLRGRASFTAIAPRRAAPPEAQPAAASPESPAAAPAAGSGHGAETN